MSDFTMSFRIVAATPKGHPGRTAKRAAFARNAKKLRRWAAERRAIRAAMRAAQGVTE